MDCFVTVRAAMPLLPGYKSNPAEPRDFTAHVACDTNKSYIMIDQRDARNV
jgi:hypothetical protein